MPAPPCTLHAQCGCRSGWTRSHRTPAKACRYRGVLVGVVFTCVRVLNKAVNHNEPMTQCSVLVGVRRCVPRWVRRCVRWCVRRWFVIFEQNKTEQNRTKQNNNYGPGVWWFLDILGNLGALLTKRPLPGGVLFMVYCSWFTVHCLLGTVR